MKTMMKKTAAYLLALLLVIQMVPAFASTASDAYSLNGVTYRDAIEIIPALDIDILKVGMENQLSVSSDYRNIVWESDHPEIATVSENGLVQAVGAGKVTITVTAEGQYKDTISFRIIADTKTEEPETIPDEQPDEQSAEPATQPEESGNDQGEAQSQDEKIVIFIKGSKTKTEYNGQLQKNTYTVSTSNEALFDESKLTMVNDHLAAESNCGVWQDTMTEADFAYDGNAEIVVSSGWLQIKPAQIEIKADDITVEEGEAPVFTASVTSGLADGDTLDLSGIEFETNEVNGETKICPVIPEGGIIGNYKIKSALPGTLTVRKMTEYPLYNLADINNTWYRLGKTTIRTQKPLDEYISGLKVDGNTKVVNADEYQAAFYDFEDLEIEVGGKKYVYSCEKNAEAIVLGANYYTASIKNVEAARNKIGGMNGTNPRWLIPEDQRFDDPNLTSGFHMNYKITLTENKTAATAQTVYNMLSVDGNTNYYKLRSGIITAKPLEKQNNGTVKKGEYILSGYDFTNVIVTIDDVEYKYNDGSLNEYENYFTVEFDEVQKVNYFNRDAKWFKKAEGWLDGAFEEYGSLPNETVAYHANYNATTHKAVERSERSVSIESSWPAGKVAYTGARITLTAKLVGFSKNVKLQWQYSTDAENWTDEPGANAIEFTYTLDNTTAQYYWRVVADDVAQ